MKIHDLEVTGSLIYNGVNLLSLTSSVTDSGSFSTQIVNLNQVSSSLNSFTSSINTTIKNKLDSESVISGSAQVSITDTTGYSTFSSSISSSIGSLSGSVATTTLGTKNRVDSIEVKTGSYATTGSNIFVGSQVITGSLYITNDMVVQGCSCLQNITASAVSIGTNTVVLNTATPAVSFAGVSVQDSGSNAGVTGSIYWDGLCNRWVYSNPSGIGYSGGMLLSGPRTSTLGSESPLTCNYLAKSGGGDHLYDSCIQEVSGSVTIGGTLCTYGVVCGASGIFSSTSYSNLYLDGTNETGWGNNISFRSQGTDFGYVGSVGSLVGNTTKDMTIWSTTGNGFRVYTNGNNPRLCIDSNGISTFSCTVCAPTFVGGTVSGTTGTFSGAISGTCATFTNNVNITNTGGAMALSFKRTDSPVGTGAIYFKDSCDNIDASISHNVTIGVGLEFGTCGTNRMYITNGGNIGIGSSTPADLLHIEKFQAGGMGMIIRNACGATSNTSMCSLISLQLVGAGQTGQLGVNLIAGKEGDYSSAGVRNAFFAIQTACGDNLYERLRITSAGNVGIDATTTYAKLHIGTASNNENNIFFTRQTTTANVIIGGLRSSLGPYWGDATSTSLSEINLETDNPYYRGAISFRTNNSDATANRAVERMRITSGGQVNINSTQTTYPFYVQAALGNWTAVFDNTTSGASGILMRSTGGSQGYYYGAYDGAGYKFFVNGSGVVNSTSTSITIISSDIKLKTDIRDYDKGLAEVLAMKPRIYKRKDNLEIDEVGFIAQEMNIALAGSMIESYKDEEGEPIHTYQLEWYPLLVKAIQEQQSTICSQSQKIAILESCLGIM
jgi:hypothetical protein